MATGDRSKNIIAQARISLDDVSKIRLNDFLMYFKLNEVIRDLSRKFGGFEKSISITLTDTDSYSLQSYGEIIHKKIIPSWDCGVVEYMPSNSFFEIANSGLTGQPQYATIFAGNLLLYPEPEEDTGSITLECLQMVPGTTASQTVDPESPSKFDYILIQGLISKFNETAIPEYLTMVDEASKHYFMKTTNHLTPDCEW